MLIPSVTRAPYTASSSLSRRVNANSQLVLRMVFVHIKLIKKGEC